MTDDMRNLWQNQPVNPVSISLEQLRKEAYRFQRTIRWRNLREYLGAAIVAAANLYYMGRFHGAVVRLGAALEVVAALVVIYTLHRRGRATSLDSLGESCVQHHRRELERQRDLLKTVWSWYLLPWVPGLVIFEVGVGLAHPAGWIWIAVLLAVCGSLFFGIWKLNERAARALQRRIDTLEQQS